MSRARWTFPLLLVVVGCGSSTESTGTEPAHPDAAVDGSLDATSDGATSDTATADTGPSADTSIATDSASDTEEAGGTDAPCPSTMASVVDGLAEAICTPTDDCCKAAGLANDVAKCRAQVSAHLLPIFDTAACGGSTVDMSRMADCHAALRDYNAGCRDRYDIYESIVVLCDRAVSGTKKLGDACKTSLECPQPTAAGDSVCDDWSSIGPGGTTSGQQCVQELMVGAGESCSEWKSPPPPSFQRCDITKDLDCVSGVCVARPASGGSCSVHTCAKGFVCNDAKMCVTPIDDGSACSTAAPCGPESACRAGVCQHLAANGAACVDSSDCLPASGGCVGGKCTPASFFTKYYAQSTTTCIP